jgi:hypothetical protein
MVEERNDNGMGDRYFDKRCPDLVNSVLLEGPRKIPAWVMCDTKIVI